MTTSIGTALDEIPVHHPFFRLLVCSVSLPISGFFFHCLFGNFFFQEFIGNINKDTVVLHDLSPPITARYVRFLPLEWISHISMRVELYGCHGR